MKETKIVELFGNDWLEELEKLEKEGWKIKSKKPIEKIRVEIVGQRFALEREKTTN